MSDFAEYMRAQEAKRTAYAEYNAASLKLELAQIKERFAEICSQHEPLAALNPEGNSMARQKQIVAARYVVFGRKMELP